MDESTQQNAALVEQAAAASESIVQQVRDLNASVTDDGAFGFGFDGGCCPGTGDVRSCRWAVVARQGGWRRRGKGASIFRAAS